MQKIKSIRKYTGLLFAAMLSCAAVLIGIRAFVVEPEIFEVNRTEVRLENWHPEHNGLRVAVLSDIHLRNHPEDLARMDRIVATVNAEKPDLIVLLGDFLGARIDPEHENASPALIAKKLSRLQARYGIFSVLGNHDWWIDGKGMKRELEKAGIRVLENETETLEIRGKPLNIVGLPDMTTRHARLRPDRLPDPATPTLLLSHDPDYFTYSTLPDYEFMLAGHTHGGQVQLPTVGAIIVPLQLSSPFSNGMFRHEGRRLFVTRGLGTSVLRMRLFCKPEIAILTIEKK